MLSSREKNVCVCKHKFSISEMEVSQSWSEGLYTVLCHKINLFNHNETNCLFQHYYIKMPSI